MKAIIFPQANIEFKPPVDLEESQCMTVPAFKGEIATGSCEGSPVVITAWMPSESERKDIAEDKPIFLSFLGGGLPPHMMTTDFNINLNPA